MVIEICYMNSKYVEFLYFIPLNVENNNLRRKLHHDVRNVENHLRSLHCESGPRNPVNKEFQLWKRYQTTVDSGGVGNLTPEDSSALLLVGNAG